MIAQSRRKFIARPLFLKKTLLGAYFSTDHAIYAPEVLEDVQEGPRPSPNISIPPFVLFLNISAKPVSVVKDLVKDPVKDPIATGWDNWPAQTWISQLSLQ